MASNQTAQRPVARKAAVCVALGIIALCIAIFTRNLTGFTIVFWRSAKQFRRRLSLGKILLRLRGESFN